MDENVKITLMEYPGESDWIAVKRRALVTAGLKLKTAPDMKWKKEILEARHSPIRRLFFSFYLEDVPYWVAGHLVRHVHSQPYIESQRNDRQSKYDRTKAPQDAPVNMIWDMSAEELLNIANKRLCKLASKETREVVETMCELVKAVCPEFEGLLVPNCVYQGGVCHEMYSCRRMKENG
jgi:thymidylate synthase ThyX